MPKYTIHEVDHETGEISKRRFKRKVFNDLKTAVEYADKYLDDYIIKETSEDGAITLV